MFSVSSAYYKLNSYIQNSILINKSSRFCISTRNFNKFLSIFVSSCVIMFLLCYTKLKALVYSKPCMTMSWIYINFAYGTMQWKHVPLALPNEVTFQVTTVIDPVSYLFDSNTSVLRVVCIDMLAFCYYAINILKVIKLNYLFIPFFINI